MPTPVRILRIIWAALVAAVLAYCAVAFVVAQKNTGEPFAMNFTDLFVEIIYSVAFVTFGIAFFLRARFRELGRPPAVYNIVSWALFESVSIYGFVPALIHSDWRLIAPPAMLSLVGFVSTFPRD